SEREISSAAAAHDAARIQTLNAAVTGVTDAYRSAARAYGFRDCGAATAQQPLYRRGNR
ncbi:MAG: hypothetical protein QOJ12_1753, partial [Thermoleophilales bacterium]|nr:hypothetical protein [Thermoleophilales bacterium]